MYNTTYTYIYNLPVYNVYYFMYLLESFITEIVAETGAEKGIMIAIICAEVSL